MRIGDELLNKHTGGRFRVIGFALEEGESKIRLKDIAREDSVSALWARKTIEKCFCVPMEPHESTDTENTDTIEERTRMVELAQDLESGTHCYPYKRGFSW